MQTPVSGWYLENRQGTSKKFYTVLIADNGVVVMAWGRIGTAGQSKIQKTARFEDAKALGMRQVYAKQSGGYQVLTEELKFTVDTDVLNEVCRRARSEPLTRAFHEARVSPRFEGDKKAVGSHYDDFVTKAQHLLDTAGDRAFEEVYAEFDELEQAWAEISNKHDEAAVTLNLTKQLLSQRLMSGTL